MPVELASGVTTRQVARILETIATDVVVQKTSIMFVINCQLLGMPFTVFLDQFIGEPSNPTENHKAELLHFICDAQSPTGSPRDEAEKINRDSVLIRAIPQQSYLSLQWTILFFNLGAEAIGPAIDTWRRALTNILEGLLADYQNPASQIAESLPNANFIVPESKALLTPGQHKILSKSEGISPAEIYAILKEKAPETEIVMYGDQYAVKTPNYGAPYHIFFVNFHNSPSLETPAETIHFVCRVGIAGDIETARMIAEKINQDLLHVKAIPNDASITIDYGAAILAHSAQTARDAISLWVHMLQKAINIIAANT